MQTLNHHRQQQLLNPDSRIGVINDGELSQLREIFNEPTLDASQKYYKYNFGSQHPVSGIDYKPISWFYEPEKIRVRIDKCSDREYDYSDLVGQQIEVAEYDRNKYIIRAILILKSDCTILADELPKVGEWWECVSVDDCFGDIFTLGKKYECTRNENLTNDKGSQNGFTAEWFAKHFRKVKTSVRKPSGWKLNVDLPNMGYKKGDTVRKREHTNVYYGNDKTEKVSRIIVDVLPYIADPIFTTEFTLSDGSTVSLTDEDIESIKKM